MALNITLLNDISAVEVKTDGEVNANALVELIIELSTALNATGFQRALLDFRAANVPPDQNTSELFGVVTLMGDMGVDSSVRLTGLVAADNPYYGHLETAAVSSGYEMRFFDDKDDALGWLTTPGAA